MVRGVYITRCKFGFLRPEAEEARLNPVEEFLKGRNKIYTLSRSTSEVRVNDYNSLLLLLWQVNIDIQFVSESSLALANYVTGYVAKAEKSHMQEIFSYTDDSQSRLFSFGVCSLRSRECGMYKASYILLGDHLLGKSDTIQWVPIDQLHKRNEKEDYFYSLLLLFHPFRNESDLIAKDQTAEEAFNRFIASNSDMQQHQEKHSEILQAQQKLMSIVIPQKN